MFCVFLWVQTEPSEVKQEMDRTHSQDITFPISIVYNDSDTLAHLSVSTHAGQTLSFSFRLFLFGVISHLAVTQFCITIFLKTAYKAGSNPAAQQRVISLLVIFWCGAFMTTVLIYWQKKLLLKILLLLLTSPLFTPFLHFLTLCFDRYSTLQHSRL